MFSWMPAAGSRHATANERPRRGDDITTLCGQFLRAEGWDPLSPEQQPAAARVWADRPRYWPTCWDCDDVWRRILAEQPGETLPSLW